MVSLRCISSLQKVDPNRKMLQIKKYVTELLNVYYNSVNPLDIIKKRNKIRTQTKNNVLVFTLFLFTFIFIDMPPNL